MYKQTEGTFKNHNYSKYEDKENKFTNNSQSEQLNKSTHRYKDSQFESYNSFITHMKLDAAKRKLDSEVYSKGLDSNSLSRSSKYRVRSKSRKAYRGLDEISPVKEMTYRDISTRSYKNPSLEFKPRNEMRQVYSSFGVNSNEEMPKSLKLNIQGMVSLNITGDTATIRISNQKL